jgi:hypothetical protein
VFVAPRAGPRRASRGAFAGGKPQECGGSALCDHKKQKARCKVIVHPHQCLHNLQRLVFTELSGIFQPFPWVYGKQAGMLHTMRLLEHTWNTTLSRFSDDLMSANQGRQEHPHHHCDSKGEQGKVRSSSGTSQISNMEITNMKGERITKYKKHL